MPFRLLYLIFVRLCGWLALLCRKALGCKLVGQAGLSQMSALADLDRLVGGRAPGLIS
jgi:hypothetical protein